MGSIWSVWDWTIFVIILFIVAVAMFVSFIFCYCINDTKEDDIKEAEKLVEEEKFKGAKAPFGTDCS